MAATPHVSSAPTQGHPSPGRSALPRFAAESVRADTLRALPENTAHQPKLPATKRHAKPRQPSPRTSSLGTGRTRNHRAPTATTAEPQRTPNTNTRGGAYILCRDIRVSELCEDGSPAGAKRITCTSHNKTVFTQGTQKSRRFRRISGIFFQVRPLGLEPRTH